MKMTNSHIYETGTIGLKIVNCLYSYQKPIKIKEIEEDTGLSKKQIYRSLSFLEGIKAITKKYELKTKARHKVPPLRTLFVSLSKSQVKNAYNILKKNGRI